MPDLRLLGPERLRGTSIGNFWVAVSDPTYDTATAREYMVKQLNPQTATPDGLAIWEQALGIPIDESRDVSFRRSRVIAKLRGRGTTTVAMIQNTAESFSNGAVAVTEYPKDYRVEIKFVGTVGTPPNMDDLTVALREIMPAHLHWEYIIIFNTWAVTAQHTWAELSTRTWDDVKERDYG